MIRTMRPGAAVLAAASCLAAAAPVHADEWTRIDVKARLANDGRVVVVETHHIVFEATDKHVSRTFGLGADQAIRLSSMTRLGPEAGAETRLAAVEDVTRPDEYRYYDRGHVYYAIPPLGERIAMAYRFEYELIGAVSPAWAIGAGPGSLASGEFDFQWPWYRAFRIVRDWREAWPQLATRYRYDHDVLLPSREGPGYVFKQIDYRLEYDTAWRDARPGTDVGAAVPSGAYRAAVLFDHLGSAAPVHTTRAPAAARLLSLVLPIVVGVLGWLLVVGSERWRRGPPIDRGFVDARFLSRSPEEIAFWLDEVRPKAQAVLERLAGEGAITIHVDRPVGHTFDDEDDPGDARLHMRRVAPDTTLTAFERAVLDDLFGNDRELTTASHHARHAGTDYDPQDEVDRRIRDAARVTGQKIGQANSRRAGRWSLAQAAIALVFAAGMIGVFRNLGQLFDGAAFAGLGGFLVVALVTGWPTGWWYRGRPIRGLLVPLVLLVVMQWAGLLIPNRPLPPAAWLASAVAVTAGYFLTLTRSRMPAGRGGAVADLLRMRDYAAAELRRGRPQLEDGWLPRLRALGLGPAIDAWRTRHGGAHAMPPDSTDRPRITSAHFTGVGPQAWSGRPHWSDPLTVYADDADDDAADEDDDHAGR
jgi:hypothetical protein